MANKTNSQPSKRTHEALAATQRLIMSILRRIFLAEEYWDQPQAEREDDNEFFFLLLSLLMVEELIVKYPALSSMLGVNLALAVTIPTLAFVFTIGIWPYPSMYVARALKHVLWCLRIGWEYETDVCYTPGILSERWRHRKSGKIRYANERH